MDIVNQALHTVGTWLTVLIGLLFGVYEVIETFIRGVLNQLGVPGNVQQIVILVVAIVFIVAVLRLFGGVLRWLLILFFILLALHVLVPALGR